MTPDKILIVGGYGEVGHRIALELEAARPGRVIVAGRHPDRAELQPARSVDVDDLSSVEAALDGVGVVVACVRQREPHLLCAAARRGIAYTSIAPPWLEGPALEPIREDARQTGARIVLAAGLQPGISSVLARGAAERVGKVDAVETALLLGIGDEYGPDSLAFLFEEITQSYSTMRDGRPVPTRAFDEPRTVRFPSPIGPRRAYTIPFRDQLYYPTTLGARTAVARLALDPPWVGGLVSTLMHTGARSWMRGGGARGAVHGLVQRLRRRYTRRDLYSLLVEVRGTAGVARCTLTGHSQAHATAVGATAIAEALYAGEVEEPGLWLAEQVIAPARFLARLAAGGLVPQFDHVAAVAHVATSKEAPCAR